MISLAICTHRRPDQLKILLNQLTNLREEREVLSEVLVINNGADPETSALTDSYQKELEIVEFSEPKLGLANARNLALEKFRSEWLWFLDDDTSVTGSALRAYQTAIQHYSNADFLGGPIHLDWSNGMPTWYRGDNLPMLNGLLGHYDCGEADKAYDDSMLGPYGANFVLSRRLIDRVGRFNPQLGVRGSHLGRGEETEYLERARLQQCSGYYVAQAGVGHRFQLDRLTLAHLWRYGIAKGDEVVASQHPQTRKPRGHWMVGVAEQFTRGTWQLLKGRRDRFYQCWINMGVARGRHLAQTRNTDQLPPRP